MDKKTIKKIAKRHGVRCHHFDQFDEPRYKDHDELSQAVVVIYSTSYGHWTMAINRDGSVIKPGDKLRKMSEEMGRMIDLAINT